MAFLVLFSAQPLTFPEGAAASRLLSATRSARPQQQMAPHIRNWLVKGVRADPAVWDHRVNPPSRKVQICSP